MPDVVLRAEGLTKRYGDLVAVNNLSLEIHEGEVFGFLGPSGQIRAGCSCTASPSPGAPPACARG